jgi:hypothetical protein
MTVVRGASEVRLSSGDDAAAIKQVRRYMGRLRGCYEFYVAHTNEAWRGTLVTLVTIEAGRVIQSKVVHGDIPDEALVGCIESRTSRWRFLEATTGELKQAFEMNWQPTVAPEP